MAFLPKEAQLGGLNGTGMCFVFHQKERSELCGYGKIVTLQAGKYSPRFSLVKPGFDITVNHHFFIEEGEKGELALRLLLENLPVHLLLGND